MIQKMIDCELKCFYCNRDLLIVYNTKKEGSQWSLERLDNHKGHYDTNTCIACLKCNLSRRTDNYDMFKLGKQLKIIKFSEECSQEDINTDTDKDNL